MLPVSNHYYKSIMYKSTRRKRRNLYRSMHSTAEWSTRILDNQTTVPKKIQSQRSFPAVSCDADTIL